MNDKHDENDKTVTTTNNSNGRKIANNKNELNAKNHPYGRNAKPNDIIPTIEFFLSEASEYITGVNIPVSGGEVF